MAMSLSSPLRRRHVLFGLLLVFLPCSLFIIVSGPDMRQEAALVQRLAELQLKLQQLDSSYKAREEDVYLLGQQLGQLLADPAAATAANASADLRLLLRNVTGLRAVPAAGGDSSQLLRLPSTYHFVPHLLLNPSSLRPAYALSKGRQGVSVALGVPTVKREDQSYLISTLQNLLEAMSQEEEDDSLIVVFIAETDEEYILQVANDIKQHFQQEIECGLIEVIAPSPSYYPDLSQLRVTLGDSAERVRWRSKQNLDFAYLMMYSQPKAVFYVQLEDDILAKPHFLTTMKVTAYEKIANKQPWFVLDFCQLGFIGKMFRCVELPWLVQFFFMFYNDKPVDWLLDHMIYSKVCNLEKDNAACRKAKDELWVHCKPSLFQHIGTQSSLKGKVQKLKDKQFGKVKLFFPHVNPEATVNSEMNAYKLYTLKRAYAGESFFWGLLPQAGDHLTFKFKKPLFIKKYLFRSGNAEHPSDRFYNATVEVMPVTPLLEADNITTDGYIVVGKFDIKGMAEGSVNRKLGAIQELRLTIHSDSDNWAILSEIHIQADDVR